MIGLLQKKIQHDAWTQENIFLHVIKEGKKQPVLTAKHRKHTKANVIFCKYRNFKILRDFDENLWLVHLT